MNPRPLPEIEDPPRSGVTRGAAQRPGILI